MTAEHKPDNAVQDASAPIFLICSERSGSNLISTVMGAHPEIYCAPPFHFGVLIFQNLFRTMDAGIESKVWRMMKRRINHRLRSLATEDHIATAEAWLSAQTEIKPKELARFLYQEVTPEAAGKTVFIKENNLHNTMFFLLDTFPNAKFVFQVRDPRDYLASTKALSEEENGNRFGSDINAIKMWREDQLGGLRALGLLGADRVSLHRYEDLLQTPEDTLKSLCATIGKEYHPEMIRFHETEQAQERARSGGRRGNVNKPLIASNFAKYRTALPEKKIRMVEDKVGDLMDIFGYPREYENTKVFTPRKRYVGLNRLQAENPPLLPLLDYS
ncbi:sulfotransferase family protein [Neptunicoccus sediminis]|uniref:sulfotransferase family protein n=1 Tax=Neptunicoccus sediminis TaxID=1892596 RepID=UPI0008461A9E|nr:sulfotransferase [Neptunicoccus sediminis]